MIPQPYTLKLPLAGAVQQDVPNATFFYVQESTEPFMVSLNGGMPFKVMGGQGLDGLDTPIRSVNITPAAGAVAATNTVVFVVGTGRIIDNRLLLTSTVNVASASTLETRLAPVSYVEGVVDVAVPAATPTVINSAYVDAKKLIYTNTGANPARLGTGASDINATTGLPLAAGASVTLEYSGAMRAYSTAGTSINVTKLRF